MESKDFLDKAALIMLEKLLERGQFPDGIMAATETNAQREGIALRCYTMAQAMENAREKYNGYARV